MGERASWTAVEVARKLVGLGYDPILAPLLPPGAAETTERLLVALDLLPVWMRRLAAQPTIRRWGYRAENLLGAHSIHFGLRKRFVDDEVRAALSAGAGQVLVLGAGYDTLAMRLAAEHPQTLFLELDHPATHALKRSGVRALAAGRPNLLLRGVDLERVALDEALGAIPEWQPARAGVVVAEGLLMYLQPESVAALFASIHTRTGPGTRVVFTWARGANGRPDLGAISRLASFVMALAGEPWRFFLAGERALAALLQPVGFAYRPDAARFDPRRRYVAPSGIDDRGWAWAPELFAVAERC